jgi:hypothetical protein
VPLCLGTPIAADDEVNGSGEAGFTEVKEVLVGGEGGTVRSGVTGVGP